MAALLQSALPVRGRRGALGPGGPGEPERKRVCRLLDTIPREAGAQLMDCAMDLDSRQKFPPDSALWAAKAKQNSTVVENHGSKGTSQPCPRCVAGESNHLIIPDGFFPKWEGQRFWINFKANPSTRMRFLAPCFPKEQGMRL